MDLHSMKRRELQKLCKEHNLPANLSNLDMIAKLSSLFKVQEKEEERPMRKTRSCLKNCDEMLSENESDVLKRKLKKVRFSPENDVFQLEEKSRRGFFDEALLTRCRAKLAKTIKISPVMKKRGKRAVQKVEKEDVDKSMGGASWITRARASLGKSAVISSPVVMKRRGKRAVQEVEKEDVVENKGGANRVTRASLGKKVVISSPVLMKKRGKRAVQDVENEDVAVENKDGLNRVTRASTSLGKSVVSSSPVVMKKRGKRALHEDEKGELAAENKVGASRVTRARALLSEKVLTSPVILKKRGKKAVQEDEKEDLVVENKGDASRVTRAGAGAGKQVLISSPVVTKKRGKKAVKEEKKSCSASSLVVDFSCPVVEEEKEVITAKILRSRKVENVAAPKNVARKRYTQNRSQGVNAVVSESKDAEEADGGITQTRRVRQSKRNRTEFMKAEPLEEKIGVTEKAGRGISTRTRKQFEAKASDVRRESEAIGVSEEAMEVVVEVKETLRRSGRHVNTEHTNLANEIDMPIKSDESTGYQTRHGAKRMSVTPQFKKAKTENTIAGTLRKKDSPNESTKSIMPEKGSEMGHIRRSKRNASGDGSLVEDADGSGTDIIISTTKKRRRDAVLEELPSQHTGRRVYRKADDISVKLKEETPVASEPRTRSGIKQDSSVQSAKKLNLSGNSGPSRTTGEKASPQHKRELSTVRKHSATGARQSKTVAVTPRMRFGSGQKSFIHTAKKSRISGDKELSHRSREFSVVPRPSEIESKVRGSKTESKVRGSKNKQTPVIDEHPRRFTRSALKGKTDAPARVRGKIYQKPQTVSKLQLSKLESSSPRVISASKGPLHIDVQSPCNEVDRSTDNLVTNASDLPEDKTTCSPPQGGLAKTSSVDLNLLGSEGPELINIHEVSSSDPLKLQNDHTELEVDISAKEHAPAVERPATYDVHSSILQIAGCSTDPISDTGNSINSCVKLQVNATEANDKTLVHTKPAEGSEVAGDLAFICRNSVDDGFSSLEQITSKGMEVNPQTIENVEPSSGGITNVVLEGSSVHEEQPMNQKPFPEDGCYAIFVCNTGDVNEHNTTAKQRENSCDTNVASPHLVQLEVDAAAGDVFPVDTNALADLSLVDQSTSARTEERPQLSKEVESISQGIDLNIVFNGPGPAIHEHEPGYQSPLAEDAEMTANPVTDNSDAACLAQLEGPTDIDAKNPSPVHLESVDNVDTVGGAGSIDDDTVNDYPFNVDQINSSEKQEANRNVNHVVAEGSTVNEEKLTAEVGDCGAAEQERDFCKQSAGFAESGGLDKDSRSAFKEVGEASSADLTNQTVSIIFSEEKNDMMHLEISMQADETLNTSSESEMQEKEFPVPNSILTSEGVSIPEYVLSKPEFSKTVICSNKEFTENSNRRMSPVESCLMREETCMNKCVEFSTSAVVADSVVGGNNKTDSNNPSSPSRVTEVGNLVVEVNKELKPEDSPSNRSSDAFERAAADVSSLQKEQSSVISVGDFENNQSKNARVEYEISKKASALDSSSREMSDMPEFVLSSTPNVTEVGQLLAKVKEQEQDDSLSLWSSGTFPKRAAEDGSPLHKDCSPIIYADDSEHNQPECARAESEIRVRVNMLDSTTRESPDMPEFISVPQSFDYNIGGGKFTENDLSPSSINLKMVAFEVDTELMNKENESERDDQPPMEREWDLEDMTFSISGDDEERRMNENISSERTTVISEDDVDRDGIPCPVIVHKFPSNADNNSQTPSEDSCEKEQGIDMSLVKSGRNFGKEFSSEHDHCHIPFKDSCGTEQGTPMSMVKSSKNCSEEFCGQYDNVNEQIKVCSAAALPQNIYEEFVGFDNQMVADLMGSTGKRTSRTGAINNEKLEENEPCPVITEKIMLEDGLEELKGNSSNLVQNLVEDSGGYCEKSDIEIITHKVSEEDRYGKDTIEPHGSEDALQQIDMNDGETVSNVKGICQENDESPILVQMDVDTNNVESSTDNLIVIEGFDQEADASGVPAKELSSYEYAMDSDALANIQYGGESVILTGQANEAQAGGLTEELSRIKDATEANAPADLQYGNGEANEAQECGLGDSCFFYDIFGPEYKSKSDKIDGEESDFWFENTTSFVRDKSEVAGRDVDISMVSPTEEQPHNSGEGHAREEGQNQ